MRTQQTAGSPAEAPKGTWNRFWFMPTDPTTLGFMRIMTGLIVIYVHLAYCFDLQAFFGERAWWDMQTANAERRDSPINIPNWLDDPHAPMTFATPQVLDRRVAVFDFLKHLPEDKSERDKALQFLYFVLDPRPQGRPPLSETGIIQSVKLIREAAPLLEEDYARIEAELAKDQIDTRALQLTVPDYFLNPLTGPERVKRWHDVLNLLKVMPVAVQPYDNFTYVLDWLGEIASLDKVRERETLYKFLTTLPDGPESRQRIEYVERWRQDPITAYAKGRYVFSVWYHVTDPTAMWVIHFVFIGIFVLFTIGLWTRVTSVLTWIAALSYIHRTQQVLFGMDTMMNVLLFYLMIGPSGAALSVDRLIQRYRASRALLAAGRQPVPWAEALLAGPRPSAMANFAVRLVQIHFCFIYAASGLAKLKGTTWWETTAAWSTIANAEFCPLLQYEFYHKFLFWLATNKPALYVVMYLTVYFTLFLEISFPFLIWTRLRPLLVCSAIVLHSAIAWVMGLTCFGLLMMTLLLSYVPSAVIRNALGWGPGSGPRLAVRYNPRDRRHARAVSLMRAFDLGGQIALHAEESAVADSPLVVAGPEGHSAADADGVFYAIRSLSFGKSVAWLLWAPGVGLLVRRFIGGSADANEVAAKSPTNWKTPIAGS